MAGSHAGLTLVSGLAGCSIFFFFQNPGDILKNKQPEEEDKVAGVIETEMKTVCPLQGGTVVIKDLVFSLDKGNKIIRYIYY